MIESTLDARGKTTMPASIREGMCVKEGTELVWHVLRDGIVVCRAKTKSIEDLRGMLIPPPGVHVTIEDMNPFR